MVGFFVILFLTYGTPGIIVLLIYIPVAILGLTLLWAIITISKSNNLAGAILFWIVSAISFPLSFLWVDWKAALIFGGLLAILFIVNGILHFITWNQQRIHRIQELLNK